MITFPNGKSYVGITKYDNPNPRFRRHCSMKGRILYNVIQKYGPKNAILEVLIQHDDYRELQRLERLFISKHGTKAPAGYNLTDGGEGTLGHKFTKEQLKRLSDAHKGLPSNRRGMTNSAVTRARISKANKGKVSPKKGKPLSEEHKRKLSVAQKARWARGDGPISWIERRR